MQYIYEDGHYPTGILAHWIIYKLMRAPLRTGGWSQIIIDVVDIYIVLVLFFNSHCTSLWVWVGWALRSQIWWRLFAKEQQKDCWSALPFVSCSLLGNLVSSPGGLCQTWWMPFRPCHYGGEQRSTLQEHFMMIYGGWNMVLVLVSCDWPPGWLCRIWSRPTRHWASNCVPVRVASLPGSTTSKSIQYTRAISIPLYYSNKYAFTREQIRIATWSANLSQSLVIKLYDQVKSLL